VAREVTEFITSGVPQAEFDAHTHNYRKVTQIGADGDYRWASPTIRDIADDDLTWAHDSIPDKDIAAVGITVATSPTSTPVKEE